MRTYSDSLLPQEIILITNCIYRSLYDVETEFQTIPFTHVFKMLACNLSSFVRYHDYNCQNGMAQLIVCWR